MDIRVSECTNGKYIFTVGENEKRLFRSCDTLFPFLGTYGSYDDEDAVFHAIGKFLFRNAAFLSSIAALDDEHQTDCTQSRIVRQFNDRLQAFMEMADTIEDTKEESLSSKIEALDQMVDQDAKAISSLLRTFENDDRVDDISEDTPIQEIGFHELNNPYAKQLLKLRRRLRKFYKKLHERFDKYVDAVASGKLRKICGSEDNDDWVADILTDYGENIVRCISLPDAKLKTITSREGGYDIVVGTGDGEIIFEVGDDLVFAGVSPLGAKTAEYPFMSPRYISDLWLPAFKSLGAFRYEDVIAVPESPPRAKPIGHQEDGQYLMNSFAGFSVKSGGPVVLSVYSQGTKNSFHAVCKFVCAGNDMPYASRRADVVEQNRKILESSKMVVCNDPSSKYFRQAGEVVPGSVREQNGYLEVSVVIKFDNGAEETVVFPSWAVKKYL